MNSTTPIQHAIESFETHAASIPAAAGVSVRLLKVLTSVLDHWIENRTIDDIGSLTDSELLGKLALSGAITGALDTRETRKLARRTEAKIEFFEKLKAFGGIHKSQAVAKLLGVSRQTVNNHVAKGKLIAIQEGNDYCYPAFQFVEKAKLPHLEDVLPLLKKASAESICSFFLNPISLSENVQRLPYELLRDGASAEQLNVIKREAGLFGTGVPS